MSGFYSFLTGSMLWISFIVFVGGSLFNIIKMFVTINKKEKQLLSYISLKHSFRSILRWSVPFGATNMRLHPFMTIATFAFHICLITAPVFILSHVVLLEESLGLIWIFVIPDHIGDAMAIIVVGACLFFLLRRLFLPEVRFVTSASDFIMLAIVAAPFITGILAYRQCVNYNFFIAAHIISGEAMLMAIPFTRLSHMLFAPFVRAFAGSEFRGVRHARDW